MNTLQISPPVPPSHLVAVIVVLAASSFCSYSFVSFSGQRMIHSICDVCLCERESIACRVMCVAETKTMAQTLLTTVGHQTTQRGTSNHKRKPKSDDSCHPAIERGISDPSPRCLSMHSLSGVGRGFRRPPSGKGLFRNSRGRTVQSVVE